MALNPHQLQVNTGEGMNVRKNKNLKPALMHDALSVSRLAALTDTVRSRSTQKYASLQNSI